MSDGWIYIDDTNPKPFLLPSKRIKRIHHLPMGNFSLRLTWAFYSLSPLISKYGAAMQSMGCHQIIENWPIMKHVPTFQFCITFGPSKHPTYLDGRAVDEKHPNGKHVNILVGSGLSSTTLKIRPTLE